MKVALYGMKTSEALEEVIPELIQVFEEKNIEYQIEKEFHEIISDFLKLDLSHIQTFTKTEELWEDLDLFFTFGGDGTILTAVTLVQGTNIPIVGVNTGRLGYLAGINKKELMPNLQDILDKNFKLSPRSLVSIQVEGEEIEFPFALNEITVMRKETTSMITIEAYIGGQLINSFWCDGLIVATPTGSTGYSLSCNGPIISPNTNNFVLTPIAPHNLNVRPLVISDDEEIKLKIHSRVPEYSMSLDARLKSMDVSQEIMVKKANFKIQIVQLHHNNYLETLRKKLFWGKDKRN